MIKPIIATTIRIPTHTPALKIPPITSHEDRKEIIQRRLPYNTTFLFITSFSRWYAKTLPGANRQLAMGNWQKITKLKSFYFTG